MKQRIFTLPVIGLVALALAAAAGAASLAVSGTITGAGALTLTMPSAPTFSATLAGDDQNVSYSPVLGVVDARGSGTGWNLTIASTALSDGSSHTLAQSLTGASSACHSGSTCTNASNNVTYPVSLSTTAAKVFDAAANSGLGKVDVIPTIQIAIPGNAYAGSYSATLTVAATSGP
jgi:hypothetical protein